MRAAVLNAIDAHAVEEVDVRPPQEGEVSVKMFAAGVCRSDLHVMTGHLPIPLRQTFPIIMGHEGAGVVQDVGKGVKSLKSGDHVIPLWRVDIDGDSDGPTAERTPIFRRGSQPIHSFMGVATFAGVSIIPENAVLKIRDDVPLDKAALFGCSVVTGVGAALHSARVRPGATVAVYGAGGIGLNVIQGARLAGAGRIIVVDVLDAKLELARKFGATDLINAKSVNPVSNVRDLTGGGVDYAFEAIGLPAAVEQAYASTRKGGKCVVVGIPPLDALVSISPFQMVIEEKTLMGSLCGSVDIRIEIPRLIELWLSGKLLVDELVTQVYPLDRINEAFAALRRGELARGLILH